MFYLKIIVRLQKNILIIIAFGIFYSLLFSNCAKELAPTGGERDTLAPYLIQTEPPNNCLNFMSDKIYFEFNENIQASNLVKNILVSPPLEKPLQAKVKGKKIVIRLNQDNLKDSTTYILNFGDAVGDLNENNKCKNLTYAFSTGPIIDSLSVSGMLVNAENNEPANGITVLLHEYGNDSAVYSKIPMYTAKSDKDGFFTINNIKDGSYSLFAIEDLNGNYTLDKITESFAFYDSLVKPEYIAKRIETDSIAKNDTIRDIDSVSQELKTKYVLKMFKHLADRQYVKDAARPKKEQYTVVFGMPLIKDSIVINNLEKGQYLLEKNETSDSVVLWLNDTSLVQNDTLCISLSFLAEDSAKNSAKNIIPKTDTLCPTVPTASKKKTDEKIIVSYPKNNSTIHFSDKITLEYNGNVTSFNSDRIALYSVTDSVVALNSAGAFYGDTLNSIKKAPNSNRYFYPAQKQSIEKQTFLWSKFYIKYKQDISSCNFDVFSLKGKSLLEKGVLEKDIVNNAVIFWFSDPNYNDGKIPDVVAKCECGGIITTDTVYFANAGSKMRKNKFLVDIYKTQKENLFLDNYLVLNVSNPIKNIDTSKISISYISDTAEVMLPAKIYMQENNRTFFIDAFWQLHSSYFLILEKGAFTDIYDNSIKETQIAFKTQEKKQEFLKAPLPISVYKTDFIGRKYAIDAALEEGKKYQLEVLPGAIYDINGKMNDTLIATFKTADEDFFSSLTIMADSSYSDYLFVLKSNGIVVQKKHCDPTSYTIMFEKLRAGKYTLEYFEDIDNDKQYSTGNYDKKIQPELVKKYSEDITVKKSWDNKLFLINNLK